MPGTTTAAASQPGSNWVGAPYKIILNAFEAGALRYVLSVGLSGYVLDPPNAALARNLEIFGGQQGFNLKFYFLRNNQ